MNRYFSLFLLLQGRSESTSGGVCGIRFLLIERVVSAVIRVL